jgi:hypothetical protein
MVTMGGGVALKAISRVYTVTIEVNEEQAGELMVDLYNGQQASAGKSVGQPRALSSVGLALMNLMDNISNGKERE